jgi:hypothetical protein
MLTAQSFPIQASNCGVNWLINYWCFWTVYGSHPQRSSSPLKTGPCTETSVTDHQPAPRNIREERRPQWHRGGRLKPRIPHGLRIKRRFILCLRIVALRCIRKAEVTLYIFWTRHWMEIWRLVDKITWRLFNTSAVLYGSETWSLTLWEKRRLRVFENGVLRGIFGRKRDKITGEWIKLRNE